MTIANFIEAMRARSQSMSGHIGFADADDLRIVQASYQLLNESSVAAVTLFTSAQKAEDLAQTAGLTLRPFGSKVSFLDIPERAERLSEAAKLVKNGTLDAVLAGNIATTAEVIRAGLNHLGLTPGVRTVSGSFVMHRPMGPTYIFADCGVVIAPTVQQLVDIAAESVRTWQFLMPETPPKVAFLSYSTNGSARHESQARVAEAARLFRASKPEILSDGELQFDAAIDAEIAQKKAPGSPLEGAANCFIFPSLEAGNIAYKLAQRLGGFQAYGPILQGLAGAYSDLSRGATVQDIVMSSYINLLRGQCLRSGI